jgi:hypothetical protein
MSQLAYSERTIINGGGLAKRPKIIGIGHARLLPSSVSRIQ